MSTATTETLVRHNPQDRNCSRWLWSEPTDDAARCRACIAPTRAGVMVRLERYRQQAVEGYTLDHDRDRGAQGLIYAASSYRASASSIPLLGEGPPATWPWAKEFWKPKGVVRDLVRAAALYQAALEVAETEMWVNHTASCRDEVIEFLDALLTETGALVDPNDLVYWGEEGQYIGIPGHVDPDAFTCAADVRAVMDDHGAQPEELPSANGNAEWSWWRPMTREYWEAHCRRGITDDAESERLYLNHLADGAYEPCGEADAGAEAWTKIATGA